jgi:hypothetical protein
VYQSLTPTSNGKVAVTVNGVSITDYVHARGLIKAAGHADNYLALADGLKSGQEVHIQETGDVTNTPLFVRNKDGNMLAVITPGHTAHLKWFWTSTSAGAWHLLDSEYAPYRRYTFDDMPSVTPHTAVDQTADAGVNVHQYPDGLTMYVRNELDQAIYVPTPIAAGVSYAFDQVDDHGFEACLAEPTQGGKTFSAFTAQGPAFYMQAKVSIQDISGTDLYVLGGFRLIEAFQDGANPAGYNTYAYFGGEDANLDVKSELNGGGTGTDDTTTDLANDATGGTTVKVMVSDAGVVSYELNGASFSPTNATLTFDDGDSVTPFFSLLYSSDVGDGMVFQELEVGYQ